MQFSFNDSRVGESILFLLCFKRPFPNHREKKHAPSIKFNAKGCLPGTEDGGTSQRECLPMQKVAVGMVFGGISHPCKKEKFRVWLSFMPVISQWRLFWSAPIRMKKCAQSSLLGGSLSMIFRGNVFCLQFSVPSTIYQKEKEENPPKKFKCVFVGDECWCFYSISCHKYLCFASFWAKIFIMESGGKINCSGKQLIPKKKLW